MDKTQAALYNFDRWIKYVAKLTRHEVAEKLFISDTWMSGIMNGKENISRDLAMKIELLTKGEVKAVDLRPQDKTLKKWRDDGKR